MKTIGLIGGMSWESTVTYYQIINETVKESLGGYHSAKILLYSVDFAEIEAALRTEDWEKNTCILTDAALRLERAGADCVLIGTNTLHKIADEVSAQLNVPLLHIAEATADALAKNGIKKTALLGTRFTMEQNFFKEKLEHRGIDVLLPNAEEREQIDRVIFGELCLGVLSQESKQRYLDIIDNLAQCGAQAVILGCTEIGLLISQKDTTVPLYDTTEIHAKRAAAFALETAENN
ncbi:MAG: aspartate/glutamate racemase family protein [Anaerofustis sp.]